jgi:ankyrin repeat protein
MPSLITCQSEIVREMLAHVPAGVRSEAPTSLSGTGVLRELDGEAGLTPLHLAAYSGDENVVRLLLNSAGVTVDQPSAQNVPHRIYYRSDVIINHF